MPIAEDGEAGCVTIKEGKPGDAGIFQWIDMQRGDIMLLSLATHRYLLAIPKNAGPVAANHPGPRPDRRDGSCFAWNVQE